MERKTNRVILMLVLMSLGTTSYLSLCCTSAAENPKNIYYENVTVLVFGRTRTITSGVPWEKRLFIGSQTYFGVAVSDTPSEVVQISILHAHPLKKIKSLSDRSNTNVFMQGVKGVFFYGCGQSFCISKIPPVIFVYCHVEKIWIYSIHSGE